MAQRAEKEDPLRLDNQICFPLYACAKEIVRQYRRVLEPLKLTYTQYLVMMVLWEFGAMTEGELGKKLRLDSGTLAPLLKRLEKQGRIDRMRPAGNERRLLVQLTPKGEALRQEALGIPEAVKECLQMPQEELEQLRGLLDRALCSMETR